MHVAYVHFGRGNIVDVGLYAFYHTACSTVCEGKTQHVGVVHSVFTSQAHAFGKYLCFSAPRRSQHKVDALLQVYHPLLAFVGLPSLCGIGHIR